MYEEEDDESIAERRPLLYDDNNNNNDDDDSDGERRPLLFHVNSYSEQMVIDFNNCKKLPKRIRKIGPDVFALILTFLDSEDVFRSLPTSKRWNYNCDRYIVWKEFYNRLKKKGKLDDIEIAPKLRKQRSGISFIQQNNEEYRRIFGSQAMNDNIDNLDNELMLEMRSVVEREAKTRLADFEKQRRLQLENAKWRRERLYHALYQRLTIAVVLILLFVIPNVIVLTLNWNITACTKPPLKLWLLVLTICCTITSLVAAINEETLVRQSRHVILIRRIIAEIYCIFLIVWIILGSIWFCSCCKCYRYYWNHCTCDCSPTLRGMVYIQMILGWIPFALTFGRHSSIALFIFQLLKHY